MLSTPDVLVFFSVGHGHKRRRIAETIDIEDRLESLITRVGEKVKCKSPTGKKKKKLLPNSDLRQQTQY